MEISLRRLSLADAPIYREIRLEALQDSPEAFGSDFEDESGRPLSHFEERLANSKVFGAFDGDRLVGTAGLARYTGKKRSHMGLLWGMYVRAAYRSQRVGRQLVQAVIDAADAVEIIQLGVASMNKPAIRLYESMGFKQYGLEKRGLNLGDRYIDEILMDRDRTIL